MRFVLALLLLHACGGTPAADGGGTDAGGDTAARDSGAADSARDSSAPRDSAIPDAPTDSIAPFDTDFPRPPPFGVECMISTYSMADPDQPVTLGTWDEAASAHTPWTPDAMVPMISGPQGGVMLQPALAIDGASFSGDEVCLHVLITHVLDADPTADYWRYEGGLTFFREGSILTTRTLNDQIGWTPEVTPVLVEATVRGASFVGRGTIHVIGMP